MGRSAKAFTSHTFPWSPTCPTTSRSRKSNQFNHNGMNSMHKRMHEHIQGRERQAIDKNGTAKYRTQIREHESERGRPEHRIASLGLNAFACRKAELSTIHVTYTDTQGSPLLRDIFRGGPISTIRRHYAVDLRGSRKCCCGIAMR